MRFQDNRSVWLDEASAYTPLPPLKEIAHADIVIIGGGLTGVSTAWQITARWPDRRVVLLEAKSLANGASGRNGGQVLTGFVGPGGDLQTQKAIYWTSCQGIALIEEYARCSHDFAGFSRSGSLSAYRDAARADAAQSKVEEARRNGLPLEWLDGPATGLANVQGGELDPNGGRINGAALVRGMRSELIARGVGLFENTPVLSISEGSQIVVRTRDGSVRAPAMVLATNAYSPQLGYFRHEILPLHSHVVALAPQSGAAWRCATEAFSDDRDRVAYGCRSAAGRIVFGGGSNAAYAYLYGGALSAAPAERDVASMIDCLRSYVPYVQHADVTHRWSGVVDLSLDRSCSIGVRGAHRNVYYAIGYSGHGLALAALAGKVICDLYSDNHEPWRGLPFYQRRLLKIPPEPLRWLGYQLYTRMTGRSPRRG